MKISVSIPECSYFQVKVVDRTAVVTANAETVAVRPIGIQEAINAEIGNSHKLILVNLHVCVNEV